MNHATRHVARSKHEPEQAPMTAEQGRALKMAEAAAERAKIERLRRDYADHVAMERKFKH